MEIKKYKELILQFYYKCIEYEYERILSDKHYTFILNQICEENCYLRKINFDINEKAQEYITNNLNTILNMKRPPKQNLTEINCINKKIINTNENNSTNTKTSANCNGNSGSNVKKRNTETEEICVIEADQEASQLKALGFRTNMLYLDSNERPKLRIFDQQSKNKFSFVSGNSNLRTLELDNDMLHLKNLDFFQENIISNSINNNSNSNSNNPKQKIYENKNIQSEEFPCLYSSGMNNNNNLNDTDSETENENEKDKGCKNIFNELHEINLNARRNKTSESYNDNTNNTLNSNTCSSNPNTDKTSLYLGTNNKNDFIFSTAKILKDFKSISNPENSGTFCVISTTGIGKQTFVNKSYTLNSNKNNKKDFKIITDSIDSPNEGKKLNSKNKINVINSEFNILDLEKKKHLSDFSNKVFKQPKNTGSKANFSLSLVEDKLNQNKIIKSKKLSLVENNNNSKLANFYKEKDKSLKTNSAGIGSNNTSNRNNYESNYLITDYTTKNVIKNFDNELYEDFDFRNIDKNNENPYPKNKKSASPIRNMKSVLLFPERCEENLTESNKEIEPKNEQKLEEENCLFENSKNYFFEIDTNRSITEPNTKNSNNEKNYNNLQSNPCFSVHNIQLINKKDFIENSNPESNNNNNKNSNYYNNSSNNNNNNNICSKIYNTHNSSNFSDNTNSNNANNQNNNFDIFSFKNLENFRLDDNEIFIDLNTKLDSTPFKPVHSERDSLSMQSKDNSFATNTKNDDTHSFILETEICVNNENKKIHNNDDRNSTNIKYSIKSKNINAENFASITAQDYTAENPTFTILREKAVEKIENKPLYSNEGFNNCISSNNNSSIIYTANINTTNEKILSTECTTLLSENTIKEKILLDVYKTGNNKSRNKSNSRDSSLDYFFGSNLIFKSPNNINTANALLNLKNKENSENINHEKNPNDKAA